MNYLIEHLWVISSKIVLVCSGGVQECVLNSVIVFMKHYAKEKKELIIEKHVTALPELSYIFPPSSLPLQLSVLSF